MPRKITISASNFEVEAELLEEENPRTCDEIWAALPFGGEAKLYLKEIYFDIPADIEPENPTTETTKGDVSYWLEQPVFCIFFGESQPVSEVNTFAKIDKEEVERLKNVGSGEKIEVSRSE